VVFSRRHSGRLILLCHVLLPLHHTRPRTHAQTRHILRGFFDLGGVFFVYVFAFKSPPHTTKKKTWRDAVVFCVVVFSFFVSCTGFHQSPSSFVCEIQGLGVFLSTRKPKKAHTFLYSRLGFNRLTISSFVRARPHTRHRL